MGAQAVRLSNVDIDNALKSKDFEVLFQPIFDLGNGALARMESFVRWRHPSLGVLPPGAFISFFESQGRMSELTRYVLAQSLDTYIEWRGRHAPGFSINLALSDLTDEAFPSHFAKLLRDRQFPADLVTLECPMPTIDTELEAASAHFSKLAETGARLAIEVRGRANDLLRMIDPFPFDEIKTGGSSILRFARTVRGPGLSAISDLLEIANKANAVITAVGVEDQASLAALRGLGFTAAQGNHLAKVGSLDDFMPSRVNDVRELLGLELLSADGLNALFRTEAPALKQAELETLQVVEEKADDGVVERLSERVSKEAEETPAKEQPAILSLTDEAAASVDEDARKARAREKAKALVLAKRAKARQARKAAAIARAKAKAAQTKENEQAVIAEAATGTDGQPVSAPHELQQRLNQEFAGGGKAQPHAHASDAMPPDAPPQTVKEEPADISSVAQSKLTVPERVAAASAKAEPAKPKAASMPEQKTEAPATPSAPTHLKLPVGEVHAYFQPGIVVGGPAMDPRLETSATRAEKALSDALRATAPPAADMPAAPAQNIDFGTEEAAPTSEKPPARDEIAEPELVASSVASSPAQATPEPEPAFGDVFNEAQADDQEDHAETKPHKQRSFLKRTVLPYPTHFWPKPWKRSFKRWTAKTSQEGDVQQEMAQAAE